MQRRKPRLPTATTPHLNNETPSITYQTKDRG